MDVKNFVDTIQKYSNNDWVKCLGITETSFLGHCQGLQKDQMEIKRLCLSTVDNPTPQKQ